MKKFNAKNERAKYKYRTHLARAKGKDPKTVFSHLKNILYYERLFGFEDFAEFNASKAHRFIDHLFETDKSLSFSNSCVRDLREFLTWLERQNGYRSKINYNHIEYLNLTNNQKRKAKAVNYKKSYRYEQIIQTIRLMPERTLLEKRDKAMVSMQALCTLRISELRTLSLINIIHEDGKYFLDICPRNVEAKFAKQRTVFFLPLPDDILQNVLSWVEILRKCEFSPQDPLFPSFRSKFNEKNLLESTVTHNFIKSGTTIRVVFERAFTNAGFEYLNPHSFRKTASLYAQNESPAFLNALRQNLGHSSIDITLNSYGQLSHKDQAENLAKVKIGE